MHSVALPTSFRDNDKVRRPESCSAFGSARAMELLEQASDPGNETLVPKLLKLSAIKPLPVTDRARIDMNISVL